MFSHVRRLQSDPRLRIRQGPTFFFQQLTFYSGVCKKNATFSFHMVAFVAGALGRRRLPLFCKEAGPPHPPYNVGATRNQVGQEVAFFLSSLRTLAAPTL